MATSKISFRISTKEPEISFTHLWVQGFGWENTIYDSDDFERFWEYGSNDHETIYEAVNGKGKTELLKVVK